MQLKEKNMTGMIVLTIAFVLLGVAIQGLLAVKRDAQSLSEAGAIAAELSEAAASRAQTRAERLALDAESLTGLPARKAAAYRDLHLELLLLVNPWNPLPEDYTVEVRPVAEWQIGDEQQMDVRCADDLERMLADCEAAGYQPYVCSSYRSHEMQELLHFNKIMRLVEMGYSWDAAPEIAAQSVAVPGTSEHELGLAADVIDYDYTNLDEWQEHTETQKWLMANSWRYGFILRYPNGTTDVTGIIYEPWHYRYVGQAFAEDIHERGVTLEEYIALRRGR